MRLKSIWLYILFFMASCIIFVFVLFPGKEVAAYLSSELKTQNFGVTIDSIKPALLFKLECENTTFLIGPDVNKPTEIVAESLTVFLDPVSIFKNKKQIKIQSDFYQGSVKGQIEVVFPLQKSSLDLKVILIADSPYLKKLASMADLNPATRNIQKTEVTVTIKGTFENPKIEI